MQNKNEKMIHVFTSWLSKTWKIAKSMLKNAKKSKLHFWIKFLWFLLPFWLSKLLQKVERTRPFFDIFPKTRPRCPQDAPRRLQDTSKTPLRPSKKPPRRLQDPPKTPPRHLWTAQRRVQAASSCREIPQEYYKFERFEKSSNFHCFSFDF